MLATCLRNWPAICMRAQASQKVADLDRMTDTTRCKLLWPSDMPNSESTHVE